MAGPSPTTGRPVTSASTTAPRLLPAKKPISPATLSSGTPERDVDAGRGHPHQQRDRKCHGAVDRATCDVDARDGRRHHRDQDDDEQHDRFLAGQDEGREVHGRIQPAHSRSRCHSSASSGLDRREVRAWAMYDWANSAFWSTVITAVFPEFFSSVAAAGLPPGVATARFATITTVAMVAIAVMSPILGAVADYAGIRKKMLGRISRRGRVGHGGHGPNLRRSSRARSRA